MLLLTVCSKGSTTSLTLAMRPSWVWTCWSSSFVCFTRVSPHYTRKGITRSNSSIRIKIFFLIAFSTFLNYHVHKGHLSIFLGHLTVYSAQTCCCGNHPPPEQHVPCEQQKLPESSLLCLSVHLSLPNIKWEKNEVTLTSNSPYLYLYMSQVKQTRVVPYISSTHTN